MSIHAHVLADGLTLAANAASEASSRPNFTNGLAGVIVALAIFGLFNLFKPTSMAVRIIVGILILGVFVVNVGFLLDFGRWIRRGITTLATNWGAPEVAGPFVFTLLVIVLLVFAIIFLRRNPTSGFLRLLVILLGTSLFTVSSFQEAIVAYSDLASQGLVKLGEGVRL
ncbi:MAG TPA: hypothetical protein VF575_02990 [Candidatus Saccharimonadales bacterium]|jgi:hypothetical protein